MSLTKQQILDEAKQLTPAERQDLIEELCQGDEVDDELSPEQRVELQRRIDALDRGEMTFRDGPQALRELFESLKRRRQ
jgi:hypothetical protein